MHSFWGGLLHCGASSSINVSYGSSSPINIRHLIWGGRMLRSPEVDFLGLSAGGAYRTGLHSASVLSHPFLELECFY